MAERRTSGGWLDRVERAGNRLPDPATLFLAGTLLLMLLSDLAVRLGWQVTRPYGENVLPVSLLTSDGVWWLLSHLVENFVDFPPLGLVLVGALASGAIGLQHALPRRLARRGREVSLWLHILLLWPLPALLGFHIFKTYWF